MIGRVIGPYRIVEKIGQGGMGVVYKGIHTALEQEVAIKVLSPELSGDRGMHERFVREARIQAKLSHPNVVNIHNYLEDGDSVFLVMEYVTGETLEKKLEREGGLAIDAAVGVCLAVLDALAFMHGKGIIHRDIKPSNIMITEGGGVKVTDFGIAKLSGEKGLTKTGIRMGTVWYMSPEQIRGEVATEASDLYALGITLYQMITGRVPFSGESEYTIMKRHLEDPPVPPCEINALIPPLLGDIIVNAIAKEKRDRFQSARDFLNALRSVPLPGATAAVSTPFAVSTPSGPPWLQMSWKPKLVAPLLLSLLLVPVVYLLVFRNDGKDVPVNASTVPAPAEGVLSPAAPAMIPQIPYSATVPSPETEGGESVEKADAAASGSGKSRSGSRDNAAVTKKVETKQAEKHGDAVKAKPKRTARPVETRLTQRKGHQRHVKVKDAANRRVVPAVKPVPATDLPPGSNSNEGWQIRQ